MFGCAITYARTGMNCEKITIEADVKRGLPNIIFTGMLSQEVRESRERIRPALINSAFSFPMKRITINFSPAESHKTGTHFDLPVAVALIQSQEEFENNNNSVFFGELRLSGEIKRVRGILPLVYAAINDGYKQIYVPFDNLKELNGLDMTYIYPLKELSDLKYSKEELAEKYFDSSKSKVLTIEKNIHEDEDYADIKGQDDLIDAFIIAASGHHHMLIVGPPGTGKTMCASRMPGVMPELLPDELMEINMIYSVASESLNKQICTTRPFRAPHVGSSSRAIVGGGPKILPGEVSLAHKGILFLDEFLEFHSDTLQSLRTIIEKREVHISLRNGYSVYPADFLLIAATNPCECGLYETDSGRCTCNINEVHKYRKKLFNPLTDRIDMHVKTGRIHYGMLKYSTDFRRSSSLFKDTIEMVRRVQSERFRNEDFSLNSMITPDKIRVYCRLSSSAEKIIEKEAENYVFSARSVHKVIKIARTIADINESEIIDEYCILTALSLRFLDYERNKSVVDEKLKID